LALMVARTPSQPAAQGALLLQIHNLHACAKCAIAIPRHRFHCFNRGLHRACRPGSSRRAV
jgi:hypothetical protein